MNETTNAATRTVTLTVSEYCELGHRLPAGTYTVEMPADYDASEVTGADIIHDSAIVICD